MSVNAKCLSEAQFATASNVTVYAAPALTTAIVDKFTATNTDASARTLSINIVPKGGAVGSSNQITKNVSIAAGATYIATEMQNQILNTGDFISVVASVASVVVCRTSGREIT